MNMKQIEDKENSMDLNVLVVGGNVDDRNALTVLISDTLHQQGFGAVQRELAGAAEVSSMSILDYIQDTRPHLFTETVHVTSVPDDVAFIGAMDVDTDTTNTLMVMLPTNQPPSIDLDEEEKVDHNSRMEVVLDSEDDDLAA
jgi:hypothetical protein